MQVNGQLPCGLASGYKECEEACLHRGLYLRVPNFGPVFEARQPVDVLADVRGLQADLKSVATDTKESEMPLTAQAVLVMFAR